MDFIGADASYEDAQAVIFGAPFDGTTSYRPGTRFGPPAIRAESDGIETYSPYLDRDLARIRVHDAGDLPFPFGNTPRVLNMIREQEEKLLVDGKMPVMLGGEHLVTLPAVERVAAHYPGLHVVHFDAHTDLRDDYLGEKLSHATVIRRVWDVVGDGRVHQMGIRSGEQEEFAFARAHTDFHPFTCAAAGAIAAAIGTEPVYVTIDLDVLDPSLFSGTGTPEAGGVLFNDLEKAILALRNLNVVAADICELSPHYDPSGVSTAVACKVLREVLLAFVK
jgi:agmatinase